MTLKSARLTTAQYLSTGTRKKYGLPDEGMVVIETTNPKLDISIKDARGGMREYLLSIGAFNDVSID